MLCEPTTGWLALKLSSRIYPWKHLVLVPLSAMKQTTAEFRIQQRKTQIMIPIWSQSWSQSWSRTSPNLVSKNFPTDPWSIPQTTNQQFMKEFLSFGGLGMSAGMLQGYVGVPLDCFKKLAIPAFPFFFSNVKPSHLPMVHPPWN